LRFGTELGQRARGVNPAFARREHQRGPAAARERRVRSTAARELEHRRIDHRALRVDVGTRLGEHLDRVGMVFGGGPHDRGLAEPFLARVDVGAAADEQLQRRGIASARGRHDDRLAFSALRVRVAPAFRSASSASTLPLVAASVIGAIAVAIGGGGFRAGAEQHPDQLDVVARTAQ
jgi:hypothetical protein